MLKVDVTAPPKQDQRHVQRQRRAGDLDIPIERGPSEAKILEERASIPDQHHHRSN
jgi:hypothetical protein